MANTARYFAIDTRFKFLVVQYVKARSNERRAVCLEVVYARADDDAVRADRPTSLSLGPLRDLRPDLTVPEVRGSSEWRLFERMQSRRVTESTKSTLWTPKYCREVDMTRDKLHFVTRPMGDCLPLIEGRMVQPHRLGCKAHVSGEGRSAKWQNLAPGRSSIRPQFWVRPNGLSRTARERVKRARVGFCDITGQTNERSMMASVVPSGVVCGNKVPTVEFPNDRTEHRLLVWLAVVNSLPFDWLMRRVVTTTVNYFVLSSIRLPHLDMSGQAARCLVEVSRRLFDLDTNGVSSYEHCWRIARLRADADAVVATAYGCDEDDLRLLLDDFPLLDRGQPSLPNEGRSTITADLLISTWRHRRGLPGGSALRRLQQARKTGAIPYVSAEFLTSIRNAQREATNSGR